MESETWCRHHTIYVVHNSLKVLQHYPYNHISPQHTQSMSISKDVCYSEEVLLPPAKVSSCKGWLFNLSKTSSKWEIIDSSTFLTVLATKLNLQVFSSFNYGYSFHTFQKSLSSLSKISKAAIYSEKILSNDFHAPHVPLFLSLTHFDTICHLLLKN